MVDSPIIEHFYNPKNPAHSASPAKKFRRFKNNNLIFKCEFKTLQKTADSLNVIVSRNRFCKKFRSMDGQLLWILFIFINLLSFIDCWSLTALNITDFSVLHVSVYFSRAFLSIKHGNQGNFNCEFF
jgi:hypothetical protein